MGKTLWQYVVSKAKSISEGALGGIETIEDWEKSRKKRREELLKSAGLYPLPTRTDLCLRRHGEFRGEGYRAVKVSYQILPECWGSGTVYYPDPLPEDRLPGVLYVSGHRAIGIHGYQQHGIMWAKRGYVALLFDTIEQHDNPGSHRGTYWGRRWDWISRGYTAAGGELLNSIRALDLLCSLPEVDPERIGATGISGGGAHSFYLAAADERIKAVASVAGVTSLGYTLSHRSFLHHCDCMYMQNPYFRDNADFGALIAPRPLLLCYATEDSLFSPEEYRLLYRKLRRIYDLYGASDNCQLLEYPGPHSYSREAIDAINRWFDAHVAREEHPPASLGPEGENPEDVVTVFNGRPPQPDRLDILPELLTMRGGVKLPSGPGDWSSARDEALSRLRERVFPTILDGEKLTVRMVGDWLAGESRYVKYSGSVAGMDVWIEVWIPPADPKDAIVALANLQIDGQGLLGRLRERFPRVQIVTVEPRGTGLEGGFVSGQVLRALSLVGLSTVTLWIHDLAEALDFLRSSGVLDGRRVYLYGAGDAAAACLYVAAFDESVDGAVLEGLPDSHLNGCYIPGILTVLDLKEAVGLLAPRPIGILGWPAPRCQWAQRLYERLGVPDRYALGGSLKAVGERVMQYGSNGGAAIQADG